MPPYVDTSRLAGVGSLTPAQAAGLYAEAGFRPIPLYGIGPEGVCRCSQGSSCASPGKHPRLAKWQKLATSDAGLVRGWSWSAAHVGLAMGGPARLVALDVDGEVGQLNLDALEGMFGSLPPTLTLSTGRGKHLLFVVPESLELGAIKNRAGILREGLDVRGEGGQIVAPPSIHVSGRRYTWSKIVPPAKLPVWLYRLMTASLDPSLEVAEEPARETAPAPPVASLEEARQRKYGESAVAKACEAIRSAGPGTRNETLNKEAFSLAQLVAGGALDSGSARRALEGAARAAGLPVGEIRKTLASAWQAGKKKPREVPPPREPKPRVVSSRSAAAVAVAIEPVIDESQRRIIRVDVDLHRMTDEALDALASCDAVFQRAGRLVDVVYDDAERFRGAPIIRNLPAARLRELLTREIRWVIERPDRRTGELRELPAKVPEDVVRAVLERGVYAKIRPLAGILEAPSMRPDGSILQAPGYDEATGFLFIPSSEFPKVPDVPTQGEANKALELLNEPFLDFPYASDPDAYVPVAAILSILARPAIQGCVPAHVFDANTRGSGKTLQSDVVAIIATGREAAKTAYPDDDAELEKVLGAYALASPRVIAFDNITRPFGGGPLDRILTATEAVELRILGASEIRRLRWNAVILATGNNVDFVADTARRCLRARVESKLENPEARENFRYPDLRAYAREHRASFVVAALTILRGFVVAGRPREGIPVWGSFEQWSQLIPAAIAWAGGHDPMATRREIQETADVVRPALAAFLEGLARMQELYRAPGGMTVSKMLEILYPDPRPPGPEPDWQAAMREALETLCPGRGGRPPTARTVGNRLRSYRGRVIGERMIEAAQDRKGIAVWACVKVEAA